LSRTTQPMMSIFVLLINNNDNNIEYQSN
jgi:hypothetical protein